MNGEPIALKIVNLEHVGALAKLLHEVEIYSFLKDLQGEVIPHLLWNRSFVFDHQVWYGIATSLCEPATKYTEVEKQKVLEVLRQRGVDHGDMETITGNGLSVEDRFQVQTKQGNLLLEV